MTDLEREVAKAIYETIDPNTGDAIATTIHMSEHGWVYSEGSIEEQLARVRETCAAAARAAIAVVVERCAEVAERVGRPVGAGDGDTYIPGTSTAAARAIRALAASEEVGS